MNFAALLIRLKSTCRSFVRSAFHDCPARHGARLTSSFPVLLHQRVDRRGDLVDQLSIEIEGLQKELHLARLDLGEIEHVVDQRQEVSARPVDLLQVRL